MIEAPKFGEVLKLRPAYEVGSIAPNPVAQIKTSDGFLFLETKQGVELKPGTIIELASLNPLRI